MSLYLIKNVTTVLPPSKIKKKLHNMWMHRLGFPDQEPIYKCFDSAFIYREGYLQHTNNQDVQGNKMFLMENPPRIRENASEFTVHSLARNSVIRSWCQSFITELDHHFSTHPLILANPIQCRSEIFPKSIGIGLKTVFSLVKQSRKSHPDMCRSALKILLDTLDNFKPEDLVEDPAEVMEEMFETLIELSALPISGFNEDEEQITSLSCSCLLALVVASGNTSKIITAASHLLRTTEALAHQCVLVPRIMTTFFRAVKNIVVGSNETFCFMQDGVQDEHIAAEVRLPIPRVRPAIKSTFSLFTFVSDSTYIYMCTNWGIYKIGTGFSGSIRSYIYKHNTLVCHNVNLIYHKKNIFIMVKHSDAIYLLNKETLELENFQLVLPQEFHIQKAIHYSDVEHIGLIYPNQQDRLVLNLYEIIITEEKKGRLILVKKIFLNLAKQYTYILGWPAYDDDIPHTFLEPTKINHDHTIVSVTASQHFTLCRTASGQVYFNGNPSSLGLKCNTSVTNTSWNQLYIGKNVNIVDMAVGHDGQHAVLITEDGVALYYGTPQRGEDGDTHKYRKTVPVRSKPFSKLDHEFVIGASCNYLSTALVTRSGKLYIYGKDNQYSNSFGLVKDVQNYHIVKVSLGKAHGVALTDNGEVITFGINNKGQCGRFNHARSGKFCANRKHRWEHDLCMLCTKCGNCTGFKNCTNSSPEVVGTRRICGCGEGHSGCTDCGICLNCVRRDSPKRSEVAIVSKKSASLKHGFKKVSSSLSSPVRNTVDDSSTPSDSELTSKKANLAPAPIELDAFVVSVSCGLHHTVLLTDQGQVFTFGLNASGQLGTGDTSTCNRIVKVDVPKAVQVAAGSHHTVILLENGDVITMGANNKGQLGRSVDEDEAIPLPVAHFGTAKGCKATWIGASGDQTFIKLDESIVNLHLLRNSIIVGDKRNLLLIPFEKQSLYKQLIINKKDGECFSFDKKSVLEFEKVASVFDPGFDFVWDFNLKDMTFICYGHYNPRLTRNSHHVNLSLPTWDFTFKKAKSRSEEEQIEGGAEQNTVNVLTCELALTSVSHALVSRQHLAMTLLACIDAISCHEKQKLFVVDYTADYDLDKKLVEYSQVNRFTITSTGWEYRPQCVEAVRFCADHNLIIGGCNFYGSRGEYTVRISIYDIGFDGGDKERVGELLAETDDLSCETPVKNKFTILFDTPITTQANCWYVLTAQISGPASECGSGGLDEVFVNDVTFQFKPSNRSTNGTDVTKGQIPCILFKKYQRLENISYDIDLDPISTLKCLYAKEISPTGLHSLYTIIEWVWKNFLKLYKQFVHSIDKEILKMSSCLEKYAIICFYVLRLIKGFLIEIYPLVPPKKYAEKPDYIDLIFDIRQLLNMMLSFNEKFLTSVQGTSTKNAVEYANKMLFMVLNSLQNVYEDMFYIFYPTPNTKWKHLCNVLRGIHDGKCNNNIFLLNAACTSLAKSLTLRKVLQHIVLMQTDSTDDTSSYMMLLHRMACKTKPQGEKVSIWNFHDAIDVLMSLVNGLTLNSINELNGKQTKSFVEGVPENFYLKLVRNCCSLLVRIVSELTLFSTEDEFQMGLEAREYFVTPSRYCFTNSTSSWVTKKGFPDAIAFEVNRPGILIIGVTVFGGIGEYVYELEILSDQTQPSNPNIPIWSSLEYKKGTFSVFGHEPIEIKFIRPIPIKENSKYAIRLWNLGRPSKSGSQGIPIVKGPDGTLFTFSKCNLSMNGTNVSIGQIPSIIYISQNKENTISRVVSAENEVKLPKKQIASICRQIISKSSNLLHAIRDVYEQNPQKCHDIFEESITFSRLLPFVLAQLTQMRDPESCVETLNMIQEILPTIVSLNTIYKDDFKLLTNTAAAYTVTVESEHPYRPSNVIVQCVKFPPNIGFMVIEMDPRCGTCQPEDSLALYIPHTSRRRNMNYFINSNLLLKHDGSDEVTSYIAIGQRYKTVIWPNKGLLIPGNEILFYMETAADYIKDEKANKFGFKCQVYGYESIPEKFSVLQKLEFDFVHIGGICAATLINSEMSPYAVKERFTPLLDDASTTGDSQDSSGLLSNGLALEQLPAIKDSLEGNLVFRHNSNKHRFLQDFIKRSQNTPGGRLANWLQPDPFIDPENCHLVAPSTNIYSGEKCEVVLILKDQHNRPVTCPDIYVELTAHQQDIIRGRQHSMSAHSSQQGLPPLDVPYTITTKENMQFHCITMIKAYQNYSLEELRMASPSINRTTEHLIIRSIIGDRVLSSWTPQSPGTYTLDCSIDGYNIQKSLQVHVYEPLEKKDPPVSAPMDLQKPDINNVRTFIDEDSAGLRIRAFPSLQSEQIGLIAGGSIITFDDVALNSDGVWLKLSHSSASHYVSTLTQDSEAWCMQFNQHLGRSLLQPNEIDNGDDTFKTTDIGINNVVDLKTKYRVIKTCDVKAMPIKNSPVVGTLIAGDMVKIKHTFSNLVETWIELSSSVVDRYGFTSNSGECWVLRSCLQTILDNGVITGEDVSGSPSHSSKNRRGKKRCDKADIVVSKRESLKKDTLEKQKKHRDALSEVSENNSHITTSKSVSFGGAIRKVKSDDAVEENEDLSEDGKKFSVKRKNVAKHKNKSPSESPQRVNSEEGPSKTKTESEKISIENESVLKDSLTQDPKPPKAISPSRAESLRASFAAFLWHEGIVDDALTCASYLKFQPNLPKEGSEVVTRPPPQLSQATISQRHSVEVTNAGNYLNIQQSTLESLNKSAMNASANRTRKRSKFEQSFYKEVSMISEEENSQCSDEVVPKGRDVVCVLPAAFRALVALWEEFGELQIQDDDVDRTLLARRVISPPKKCSDKDSSQHSTDSDDNFYSQDITHVFENCEKQTCELCLETVALPMTNHYVQAHEGCGRFSCRGYNYTGLYTKGWFGKCGTTETTTLGLGYIYCDVCHDKNLKDLKDKMEGGQIDEPPSVPNVHHLIMTSNSMFLLDIEPIHDSDENPKNTANSSTTYFDPWVTTKDYNSLQNLSSFTGYCDKDNDMFEYKTNITTDPRPNTSVHRSASMSIKSLDECLTSASSLLCHPSKALLKLVGFDTAEGQSISSVGSITINKEMLYSRPAVSLLCQGDKDIQKIKLKMVNAVRTATIRKYGFQALNWLIHTTTQPMGLHDLMWLFCGAMIDNSPQDETRTSDNDGNEETIHTQWWSDWLAGSALCREVRIALHRFLQSVSDLIPHLPLTSPLLLQAIQCWGINFTAEDHHFLHDSQIFNNISRILSNNDEAMIEDVETNSTHRMEITGDDQVPTLSTIHELTHLCSFVVSSRQDMVDFLTDGSTETFWESSDENRAKPKTIDITLPQGVIASTVWIHLDNVRDAATRALGISVSYSGADGLHKELVQDISINYCGWVSFSLHDATAVNRVIHCELRGICNSVRARQVKLFGSLTDVFSDPITPFNSVIKLTIQNETLHVFRNITYQVFGPVIFDETFNLNDGHNRPLSMIEDGHFNGHNDLREHVVGILFSQETLTVLQKQLMVHIVNAITSEAQRTRDLWENNMKNLNDSSLLNDQDLEANQHSDDFCYEMISMVLTLSGCPLGRSSLSKYSFLIRDLLTLLHAGSARVQRQVIAILRRMIDEVTPMKMMTALNGNHLNGNMAPKETFIDHLIICISKSLRVQVKNRNGGSSTISQPVTMAGAMEQSSVDPSTPWYYRGYMSKRHAQMIIQLLNDMIRDKMSPQWAQVTTISISEYILALTNLTDEERVPSKCIASPILWRAMGSLCVVTEDQANRLNNRSWQNTSRESTSSASSARPMCVNHDDGETLAMIECNQCGPMCQDCDRVLHLSKLNRIHQRQVCKEEVTAIQVELHEGCGRVKLFWLLAFVDQRSLKSIIEFRLPVMNKFAFVSSKSTGQCRFCGAHGDTGLLSIGNVCAEKECQDHSKNACTRILHCGHHCGGYKGETECLPCLHGCAYVTGETPQQDEAASKPIDRPILRQDAEDMCMICFTDRLISAPAVLLLCGHVFHYHCTKKILESRWIGPRISFTFSFCPICKVEIDHPAFKELLEPIRNLQKDVRCKALIRLEYESLTNAAVIQTRYNGSAVDYAMDRYSYYVCFICKKAYFGGEAHCDADNLNTNSQYNPAELVCGGCSDVTQSKMCKLHGSDYLEYKCRYCCTIAIFFCLGDTHFCGGCHDQFQVIRRLSLDELPHCPAGPKGVQLEGTSDDCPLRVKHPPTGYEFALGCGICRNNINF